ncbi:retrotransposon protein, putative, ty1-copia subclass [Tanacetum coccineum]
MDQARIYPIPTTTRCHAPPSPPPTSAAAAMPPYTTSTTPRTITSTDKIINHLHSQSPAILATITIEPPRGGLVRWAAATMGWVGVTATKEGVEVGFGTSSGACLFGGSRHHKGAIGLAVDSRGGCQVGFNNHMGAFVWLAATTAGCGWLAATIAGCVWLAATTAGCRWLAATTAGTKRAKHNLDSTYLWHYRLAHISKKRIEKLQQEGLLKSTDDESFDQCVSCLSGKMTRKSFPHRPERATDLLGIIHTDVCGPLRHVSRQGASYFITFTDDYSRYGYVYLLKHKHEVFETFKVFKNEVENQLWKTIKALRSDRGGEYISQEFKDYLKANGIVQQLTPPYTPQHNGVSERRNRTLLDMVRSRMNLTTLLLSFWDYALESATRILNMVPTKKGCEALVKRDTPYKLQQRSVKCIFIGYLKEIMGYYFYFPPENKIVVTRYVELFEKNLITQEVSRRARDIEEIQDEDTSPSKITREIPIEVKGFEPPQKENILIRRSKRTRRSSNRLSLNVEIKEHSLGDLNEPTSYKAAMLDSESNKWIDAMNAEIQSMMDNMVWVLVDLPPGCKTVGSKWIFKKKTDMDGIVHTYKARLVAKGYTQLYGVDYEETFSPVADIRAIRILISIAAFYDYEIWQMDVKTAFLNGYLDEDIYMVQPEGFVDPNHPRKVCKLQRSIYGLKQASRSWNKRFDEEIKRLVGVMLHSSSWEAAFILGIKIYRDRRSGLEELHETVPLQCCKNLINNSMRKKLPWKLFGLGNLSQGLFLIGRLSVVVVRPVNTRHRWDETCLLDIIVIKSTDVVGWTALYDAHTEIACLMLGSMTPELHRQFELHYPYDMIQELRSMFEKQAGVEKFDLIQSFHACKQEEGKSVADYVLKMKGYVEQLERLGYVLPQDFSARLNFMPY